MAWTEFDPADRCRECGLWKSSEVVCLEGEGPEDPDVAVVGEAPGEEEERLGTPFVGRAGRLLNRALLSAGLRRVLVRVENAVRCRPTVLATGKNRKPTHHELDCCRGYLHEELLRIRPKAIVCLGETASQGVLGYRPGGVLDSRGKVIWSDVYQAWVVLTFHPAFVLRKPAQEELLVEDLIRARRLAEEGQPPEQATVDYRVATTVEEAMAFRDEILRAQEVAFDWETEGLHLTKARGFCVSFSIRERQAFIIPRYRQGWMPYWGIDLPTIDREVLRPIFESRVPKIGHHVAFDDCITKTTLGIWPVNVTFCTLIAHHCLNAHLGERAHGLKVLADLYTDVGRYDDPLDDWLVENGYTVNGKPDYGKLWLAPDEVVWPYNGTDSDVTLRLKHIFEVQLKEAG